LADAPAVQWVSTEIADLNLQRLTGARIEEKRGGAVVPAEIEHVIQRCGDRVE
jgi:hypothetical protein